jgi:hypothetical protein
MVTMEDIADKLKPYRHYSGAILEALTCIAAKRRIAVKRIAAGARITMYGFYNV